MADVNGSLRDNAADGIVQAAIAGASSIGIEALNALSTGIALLDTRSHVLWANATATRLFNMRAVFKASSPLPLALCNADSHEALREAIADAGRSSSAALQLRANDARAVISAVVLPLPASREWNLQAPFAVLLAMNELVRSQSIPDRWLSQMFGLTRAEASITNWLILGRTIDQYAQHRGISLETVRSQLKAVLSKTGMSRQAQLVATLSRLPIEHASS